MPISKKRRLAKAQLELLRRKAWDDLYVFAKYVCGWDLMENQPHRELCEFITAGLDKLDLLDLGVNPPITTDHVKNCDKKSKKLIMLPRGAFKSTVVVNAFLIWSLWHNPNLRIMIDSETLSQSKSLLHGIKDLIDNNKMLKIICTNSDGEFLLEPNKKVAGGWTDTQVRLKQRTNTGQKEPSIFCSGVDNAQTGMHPDIIIMDDLVSERNTLTDGQLEKTKNHYKYSKSLLEPGGLQIIIGTRYHMADLYGDLLSFKSFDKLIRPAILDNGELYFPSRLTKEFLEEQKEEQGSYIFSSQYMLNPIDDDEATFTEAHIQYYDKRPPLVGVHILIDLAISKKETADYTVVMAVGVTKDKKLYIVDYDRARYEPKETIDSIFEMYEKYNTFNIKTVGIETVAFQKSMIYFVRDEMRRRGKYMPLKELKADRDKERRIKSLQPLFENGDVYMKREHTALRQELLEFPFSKHDDTVDALAYILQVLRAGKIYTKSRKYKYKPANNITGY